MSWDFGECKEVWKSFIACSEFRNLLRKQRVSYIFTEPCSKEANKLRNLSESLNSTLRILESSEVVKRSGNLHGTLYSIFRIPESSEEVKRSGMLYRTLYRMFRIPESLKK